MAREFSATTHVITCGSAASLDNLATWTMAAWAYPRTGGGADRGRLFNKGTGTDGAKYFTMQNNTPQVLQFSVSQKRATTAALSQSVNNTIVFNAWQFLAATYPHADTIRLYRGTPSARVAEVAYALQQAGAGAILDDSANSLLLGNNEDGFRAFDGVQAGYGLWTVTLSVDELAAVQRGLVVRPDACVLWLPAWGVTSPEPDWSGQGNHGVLTGTTRADHPAGISAVGFAPQPRRRRLTETDAAVAVRSLRTRRRGALIQSTKRRRPH